MRLRLDRASPIPLGDQLRGQLRLLIATGDLAPGERLPTVRDLAEAQDVNVNTVASAYASLADDGYVVQRKRAGTHVADSPPDAAGRTVLARLATDLADAARAVGATPSELVEVVAAQSQVMAAAGMRVALVANGSLQRDELEARVSAMRIPNATFESVTPSEYDSTRYHVTIVHPALTADWRPRPHQQARTGPHLDFGPEYPSPAD